MARFKLYIEYDGTSYGGWQMQKNTKTVQGTILNAAEKIFKEGKTDLQGSGRTDSGVHAVCQVAHLDAKTAFSPEIIKMKLNDELPYNINILKVEKTHSKFHTRHDAVKRSYIYQISKRRTAFGKNYVWWIKDNLNFERMQKASKLFAGMNDFASFSSDEPDEKSTKVLIEDIQMKEEGDLILIRIIGSHFLWKMVRRIIGVLVEIGRGNFNEKDIKNFLTTKSDIPAKFTAPPSGLFLEQVIYKGDQINRELKPLIPIIHKNFRKS